MTPSPRRKAVSMAVAAGLLAFLAVVVSPAAAAAAAGASDARAREEGDRPWRGETQQHPQHVKAPCSLSTDGEGDLDGWLVPTEPCLVHRPPSREGATDTLPAECLKCVPRPHGLEEENSEGEREEGEGEGTFFSSGVGRSSGGGGSGGYGRGSRERQQGPRSFAPKGLDAERGWEGQFAEQALLEQRGSWQQQQQQQQQKERSSVSEREEGEGEVEEEEEEAAERGVGETGTEDADNNLEESMAVAVRNADGDDNGDAAGPGFGGAGAFAALVMAAAAAAASSVTSEALTGVTTALSSSASSSSAAGGEWEWGLDSGVADVDAGGRPDGEPDGGKSVGNPDGFPERFPQRSLDESPERLPDGSPAGRSDVRAEVRWASGTALRGGREATAAAGKGGGGGGGGGGGVARGVTTEERYGEDGRGVSRAMQEVTLAPTPSTIVDTPTPAPAALTTPAPVGLATPTPAPAAGITDAPEGAVTIEPTTEVTVVGATPAPSPVETLSPDETPAPSLTISPEELGSLVPTLLETLNPNGTLAPAAVNSTLSPLGVGETHAPTTFMPTLSPLGPGETHAPSITPAPGATREPSTSAPTEMFVDTPSPVANVTSTEEALETTADAATGAVAVGVAATAAVATVTTVTATTAATTAVTTTAATTTLTSTVTTVASSAATTTGGAGGVTTTGAGAAGSATSGVTATGGTTLTTATTTTTTQATSAGLPDVTSTARTTNVQGNIQTNATSGGVENSTAMGAADPGSISARAPSATLGLLMIFQMQFVSLLRMLEANITRPFMKFLDNMKWMNLHFEVDISFFNCDNEETRFDWANDDNGTWALNTFLVFALLGLLILVHILLVSYLEAAWLARANAIHRHRLDFVRRQAAEEETAPFDGRSAAAYAKYIDAKNQDRDLYEQEKLSTERYLRRHYSVWMYFPHVELLFLLLTYQGASAAEARLIYSGCFPLVVLGLCALIVFPLLMFIYVNRIVWSRLCTERSPVLFTPHENTRGGCCLFNACRGICGSWSTGSSMLAWADKGQWVSKNDETVDLDSRKFRIGFEPLFVDYTQRGTLYVTYLLFEWFAFGLIAGLVTNGTIQTSLICLIYTMDLVVLVCLQPFSNSIIQCVTTMTVLADALTLGLMVYASVLEPEDSGDKEKLDLIYTGALLIQTLTIIFFIVPLYLDAFITVVGTICAKAGQLLKGKEKKSKTLIRGSCDETMWIFFALVRENFIGCIKSTWKGPSYNPTANAQGVLRRRSTLLHPVDESASEEEVENPGFGKRPRRVKSAHAPTARRSHHMSTSNTLQDFSDSDHGPSERMEGGSLQRRGSANSSGGLSRGPSTYSRSSGSGRR